MITLILVGVVFFSTLVAGLRHPKGSMERMDSPFVSLILSGIAFVFCMFIAVIFFRGTTEHEDVHTEQLVSLKDSVESQGEFSASFVLIGGGISGSAGPVSTYSWYTPTEDEGFMLRTVTDDDLTDVTIYETAVREPQAVRTQKYETKMINETVFPFSFGDRIDGVTEWAVYVPPGTVVRDFTLNAE